MAAMAEIYPLQMLLLTTLTDELPRASHHGQRTDHLVDTNSVAVAHRCQPDRSQSTRGLRPARVSADGCASDVEPSAWPAVEIARARHHLAGIIYPMTSDSSQPSAETLFDEFLSRHESGSQPDFEELCRLYTYRPHSALVGREGVGVYRQGTQSK